MDGAAPRNSLFGSATVIAAIISSLTALLTAILPGLLSPERPSPITPTPATQAAQPLSPPAGAAAFSATRPQAGDEAQPNLTFGVWTITSSVDDAGTDFSGSTLKFTSQQVTSTGLRATGFFEWRTGQRVFGREYVEATYNAATRQLFIESQYVDNPAELAPGTFSATLAEDGRQLTDGAWGNTPGQLAGVLGTWEARR
ncbi:MAG: hypothetical protein DCC67_18260 [Planctomycetota bacterium]|nr:MAG: hypothetical protein DCC67_18260 [Planctomycetota bacterium]